MDNPVAGGGGPRPVRCSGRSGESILWAALFTAVLLLGLSSRMQGARAGEAPQCGAVDTGLQGDGRRLTREALQETDLTPRSARATTASRPRNHQVLALMWTLSDADKPVRRSGP